MPKFQPTKIEIIILFIGASIIIWWTTVEYQLIIPKPPQLFLPPSEFQTGDLLFFRGLSWIEKTIQTYTKSRYNHVSMIVKENGKYFLWESDVGEKYRKGPRMIPLETKLERWRGTKEISCRPIKVPLDLEKVLQVANGKLKGEFDKSMMKWLIKNWPRDGEKYFCSELIADTLQNLGVLSKKKRATAYSPKDLAFGDLPSHHKTRLIRRE